MTRTVAMPKDTNPNGDIFGGWLMSQMDLGSGILASKRAKTRVVTVALDGMSFLQPVRVGDTVACYARVESIGRTSMKIPVEVWVQRYMQTDKIFAGIILIGVIGLLTDQAFRWLGRVSRAARYCPPPSPLDPLPSVIDSGPDASLVIIGSDGCNSGMELECLAENRRCCLTRPALIFCT